VEIAEKYLQDDSLTELRLTLANAAEARVRASSIPAGDRLYVQAVVHQIRQERETASQFLQQAVAAEPHRVLWRYRLSRLLWELGRLEEAEREAQACLGISPDSRRYQALLRTIRAAAAKQ
jgi:tetratricopeptide (TPR) repeat protein